MLQVLDEYKKVNHCGPLVDFLRHMDNIALLRENFFKKKSLEDISPFCGATDTPDVSSGFQSQCGQPYSHLAEAYVMYVPRDSPLV